MKCLNILSAIFLSASCCLFAGVQCAENLKLKDGVSFYQDLDNGFPILASGIEDAVLEPTRATFVFIGASGDLNTNRQARRVVELYKRYKTTSVKFVVIDVDHPASSEARSLVRTYYRSYIPFEMVFNKQGQKVWSQVGEVDSKLLERQLDSVL